jgi:hypothetical protein
MAANSKQSFIKHNIVPANDNDAFNDNKCSFCWDSYHNDHPGVRVLPCNHVFGRDCVMQMINTPNGDKCPLCRTLWFRPSPLGDIGHWMDAANFHYLNIVHHVLVCIILAVDEWLDALPYELGLWFRALWRCLVFLDNLIWYFELLAIQFTDIYARNPQLEQEAGLIKRISQFLNIVFIMMGLCLTGRNALILWVLACFTPYVFAVLFLCCACIDLVASHRDRVIASGIMLAAFGIQVFIMIVVGPVSLTPWGRLFKLIELGSI